MPEEISWPSGLQSSEHLPWEYFCTRSPTHSGQTCVLATALSMPFTFFVLIFLHSPSSVHCSFAFKTETSWLCCSTCTWSSGCSALTYMLHSSGSHSSKPTSVVGSTVFISTAWTLLFPGPLVWLLSPGFLAVCRSLFYSLCSACGLWTIARHE